MQILLNQLQVQTELGVDKKFMLGRRYKQDTDKRIIQEVIIFSYSNCPINGSDPAHRGAVVALADSPTRQFRVFAELLFDTYAEAEYARYNLFLD